MKKNQHLYFFLASLIFVLALNAGFYYFYKEKTKTVSKEQGNIQENKSESKIVNQLSASSTLSLLKINKSDYMLGDKDAKIEMIIYDDPMGAFSSEYFSRVKILQKEFKNDLKIALRLFPSGISKYSSSSSLVVICAGEQGKYFEAYKAVLQANKNHKISQEYLENLDKEVDIDKDKFQSCLREGKAQKKLDKWTREAEENYIIGAPSTFINNYPYLGAYQLDDFRDSAGFERKGLRTVVNRLLIN